MLGQSFGAFCVTCYLSLAPEGLREAFLTGGLFGYDGVHPTPLGYAYIANKFIDSINTAFGAQIPEVNLYPFIFGPLPTGAATVSGKAGGGQLYANYILTPEARRNLLLSTGVPQWIVDGTKPPRKPRHPRG